MTTVDPEEVASLTGDDDARRADGREVAPRDFAQPLRLGPERLNAVRRRFDAGLFRVASAVSEALGRSYELELLGLREVHADAVRQGLAEPLAVTRFTVDGQVGWAVWENAAAVRAVERLLCGGAPAKVDRGLSALEADVVAGVIERVVAACAGAVEVAIAEHAPVRSLATLGTWHEAGDEADPHRVAFDVAVAYGDEKSELCVYLPGLAARAADEEAAPPPRLPRHLEDVDVVLSARLGEVEVPLADLLALEAGDVIPLGTPVDGTLAVTIDGTPLARGVLGKNRGRLAVRLSEIHEPGSAEEPPMETDS